jgi:hypothetical protein
MLERLRVGLQFEEKVDSPGATDLPKACMNGLQRWLSCGNFGGCGRTNSSPSRKSVLMRQDCLLLLCICLASGVAAGAGRGYDNVFVAVGR